MAAAAAAAATSPGPNADPRNSSSFSVGAAAPPSAAAAAAATVAAGASGGVPGSPRHGLTVLLPARFSSGGAVDGDVEVSPGAAVAAPSPQQLRLALMVARQQVSRPDLNQDLNQEPESGLG